MEPAKQDVAYFCPDCGSAAVDFSSLEGGPATCRACNWKGYRDALMAHVFKQESGDSDQVMQQMLNDMRKAYALSAKNFGAFLVKWGFIDSQNIDTKQVTRFIAAMSLGAFNALIDERVKLDKERAENNG